MSGWVCWSVLKSSFMSNLCLYILANRSVETSSVLIALDQPEETPAVTLAPGQERGVVLVFDYDNIALEST